MILASVSLGTHTTTTARVGGWSVDGCWVGGCEISCRANRRVGVVGCRCNNHWSGGVIVGGECCVCAARVGMLISVCVYVYLCTCICVRVCVRLRVMTIPLILKQ